MTLQHLFLPLALLCLAGGTQAQPRTAPASQGLRPAAQPFPLPHAESSAAMGLVADTFSGTDIGAQINAAFASVAGTRAKASPSALVRLTPGRTYIYATAIEIPHEATAPYISAPTLDCQGSVLKFTGTGDAVIVHGENALHPGSTGAIRNCVIQGDAPHSSRVTAIIHIVDRLGFVLENVNVQDAQTCIDWENTTADGGPGYNEEDTFNNIGTAGCAVHIGMRQAATGTGSFEYNSVTNVHMQMTNFNGEERGLALLAGKNTFDTQGSVFDLKLNTFGSRAPGQPPVSLVYIDGRNALLRSVVSLHGENTGGLAEAYSVNVKAGVFYAEGSNNTTGTAVLSSGQYNQYVLHPSLSDVKTDLYADKAVHMEAEAGVIEQRRCKFDITSGAFTSWLASYGGVENDCQFQVVARNTDNVNTDVYHAGTGSPIMNVMYADGQAKGVGFGPGYGGTGAKPTLALESANGIANRMLKIGVRGASLVSVFDRAGDLHDAFDGATAPGQASFKHDETFYDYTTYATVTGMSRFASGGQVHYTIPALTVTQALTILKTPTVIIASTASASRLVLQGGINHVTGTVPLVTIEVPADFSATRGGCVSLIFDSANSTTTEGNIFSAASYTAGSLHQACWGGMKWYIE